VAGLSGTGLLADDLYLIAHNDVTGRPLVHRRALGLGLAGALPAELVAAGAIAVEGERLAITGEDMARGELASLILNMVAGEHVAHPVRDWLVFFARTAMADVEGRLAGAGYVTRAGGRGWRRLGRWVLADADSAVVAVLRARAALDRARPVPGHGAVLAGLAAACGLGFRLAQYAPAAPCRRVEAAVAQLRPGLRDLIAQTQAAVDAALLSQRV
jgi:hypothetical protein